MSDKELEAIKKRKLEELQKRIDFREQKKEQINRHKVLNKIFKGRAWEVFHAAQAQYPSAMNKIETLLVNPEVVWGALDYRKKYDKDIN